MQEAGTRPPRGSTEAPHPQHTPVAVAEAGGSLQLSLVTFADFPFEVVLHVTAERFK